MVRGNGERSFARGLFGVPEKDENRLAKVSRLCVGRRMEIDVVDDRFE